jgi:hypothetical protein
VSLVRGGLRNLPIALKAGMAVVLAFDDDGASRGFQPSKPGARGRGFGEVCACHDVGRLDLTCGMRSMGA